MADSDEFDVDRELSERLVPDPANPDVRRLLGFLLGRSSRDGYLRLYLNTDLTEWLEFPRDQVVHAKQLQKNQTIVWVRPETRIQVTRTGSVPVEFLSGGIIRDQLGGARPSGFRRVMGVAQAEASGCGHGQASCSMSCPAHPGTGGGSDTAGFSCACDS